MVTEVNGIPLALGPADADDGSEGRMMRGALIAAAVNIKKTPVGYKVPSQSGQGNYIVNLDGDAPYCSCPDYELRRVACKHVYAIEYIIRREELSDGSTVETRAVRVTYSRDWRNYNAAQVNEGDHFLVLLRELCDTVEQPEYTFGRPSLPLSDMLFGMGIKTYSTMSGRRAMSDIRSAESRGLLDKVPSVASCWRYMEKPEMKGLLQSLIERSALPLASLETHLSPDSSGFASKSYLRHFDKKWGKETREAVWTKAHIMSGSLTNIVVAADVTNEASNDSPYLRQFLNIAAPNFNIKEVSADKAYLGKKNLRAIEAVGAIPLIPFKVNSVPFTANHGRDRVWERAFYYFNLHRGDFLARYHQRSNVESTFSAIKRLMGASLRSKTPAAMVNETLLKILCYNITCLVHAMYEFGIHPEFFAPTPVEREIVWTAEGQSVMALP